MSSDLEKQWNSSKYEGYITCYNCIPNFGKDTLRTLLFVTVNKYLYRIKYYNRWVGGGVVLSEKIQKRNIRLVNSPLIDFYIWIH